ncbi:MAG: MCE family protein [Planctomycetota bacterium]|nr:MAG: MCE family protein [Planctomycetota bacterium]
MSDYETTQKRRNITVGIFVVVAVCALVWLIFKFGDMPTAVSKLRSFRVFVQFPTAPGVQKDTPVRFCGYQIGRVTKVKAPEMLTDLHTGLKYHQTVVVLSIVKKYVNIPSNVEVKLMTRGLGSSYIELTVDPTLTLTPRDPNRPETKFLTDKMFLQGSTGMTSEFFPAESQKKLEELVNGLRTLINNANDILGDKANKENLKATLANLSEATNQATHALKEFQQFFSSGIDTTEQLTETVTELGLVLEKINSGQGTVAKLINDGRLYENLLENSQQLEVLIEELRSFIAKARDKGLPIKVK